jgi:hypothetical protein
VTDVTPARWLTVESDSVVAALLPGGFEAYARILHPADSPESRPVPWRVVADWAGRVMHPGVQFKAVSRPVRGHGRTPPPWDEAPERGNLAAASLRALCAVLGRYTQTPEHCYFCLWDGWGLLRGKPATAVVRAAKNGPAPPPMETEAQLIDTPRVRLPWRDYLLFEGPLDAATEMGDRGPDYFFPQSPNIFWPADRGWCVATDIELDSTYVAGSAALAQALSSDPGLEVVEARPADRIDEDSDLVNR